jgi:isoleucyl-tRNA synthetase
VASDGALTVALDVNVTDELRREGWAREVVKRIQTKRKESGFEITDRVVVKLAKNEQVEAVVEHFGRYISEQVLADELLMVDGLSEGEVLDLKDFVTTVSVSKVVK